MAEHALAAPLGIALKGLGVNNLNTEFRRGEFALKDAFEILKVPLMVSVILLAFLFFSIFIYVYMNKKSLDELEIELYDKMKMDVFNKTYFILGKHIEEMPTAENGYAEAIDNAFNKIYKDYLTALNQSSFKGLPKVRSAVDVWTEIFNKIEEVGREPTQNGFVRRGANIYPLPSRSDPKVPDQKNKDLLKIEFSLRSLEVDNSSRRNSFRIEGRCYGPRGIVRLSNLLNKSDLFKEVKHNISEIKYSESEKRGKLYDTRPTFSIRGNIIHIMPKKKLKKK